MDQKPVSDIPDYAVLAEQLFPFPTRCCSWNRKRILWKREHWITSEISKLQTAKKEADKG